MSSAIEGLLFGWKKNLDYGPKLVADLSDEQMIAQPVGVGEQPANHPAWVFSHLNVYLPVIKALIQRKEFADPKDHPFGMLSKPESDSSIYDSKDKLIGTFVSEHEEIASMLSAADDSILDQKVLLPRWAEIMPKTGVALPYLMLNHENGHLGQLSAWRRVQALPSV